MFSAPAWLWALLAAGLPLALHLWSRRPNTVIRVSSVRHLQGLPTARRWSRKLTQPLLLVLRVAVIILLALALAKPRTMAPVAGRGGPVVLLDPRLLTDSVALRTDPLLDSLRRHGEKVRLLATGLAATPLAKPAFWYTDDRSAIWDLVAQADRALAPDNGLLVISRASPERLGGVRPRVTAPVRWHVPAGASPRWWIGDARHSGDSLRVRLFRGDERGVRALSVASAVADRRAAAAGPLPGEWGRLALEIDSAAARVRLVTAGRPAAAIPGIDSGWKEVVPAAVRQVAIDSTVPRAQAVRLRLAALAVARELGDSLVFVGPRAQPSEGKGTRVSLPGGLAESTVLSPALADSVLARWPERPGLGDDSRAVGPGQLEPVLASGPSLPRQSDARRWLLVLAGLLLVLERWVATRGILGRRP